MVSRPCRNISRDIVGVQPVCLDSSHTNLKNLKISNTYRINGFDLNLVTQNVHAKITSYFACKNRTFSNSVNINFVIQMSFNGHLKI